MIHTLTVHPVVKSKVDSCTHNISPLHSIGDNGDGAVPAVKGDKARRSIIIIDKEINRNVEEVVADSKKHSIDSNDYWPEMNEAEGE